MLASLTSSAISAAALRREVGVVFQSGAMTIKPRSSRAARMPGRPQNSSAPMSSPRPPWISNTRRWAASYGAFTPPVSRFAGRYRSQRAGGGHTMISARCRHGADDRPRQHARSLSASRREEKA